MSRPLRIEYANAFYHVMNRGAGRRAIFNTEDEQYLFLALLSEAHSQYNIEVHSYCLMTNHYHLLIKTPMANLSRAMRHINGIYTQRYNRLNRTDGPLFRGRYKSILVDSDAYLIHLSKYIHLNPREGRMVQILSEYKWSSYQSFIGLSETPNWLFKEAIYGQLNKISHHAENYKLFVESIGQDERMIEFYSKERMAPVLGRDIFKQKLQFLNQSIEIPRIDRLISRPSIFSIIENTSKEFDVSDDSILYPKKGRGLTNTARKVAMYIAHKKYGYLLSEIALALQIKHYGSVANAISLLNEKIEKIPEILIQINSIIKRLDPSSLDLKDLTPLLLTFRDLYMPTHETFLSKQEIKWISERRITRLSDNKEVQIYPMGAERYLASILSENKDDRFNIKTEIVGKNVLVIPGHGNSIFIFANSGAKSVTVFDKDPITIAWIKAFKKYYHYKEESYPSIGELMAALTQWYPPLMALPSGRYSNAIFWAIQPNLLRRAYIHYMLFLVLQAIGSKARGNFELEKNIHFFAGTIDDIMKNKEKQNFDTAFVPYLLGVQNGIEKEKEIIDFIKQLIEIIPKGHILVNPSRNTKEFFIMGTQYCHCNISDIAALQPYFITEDRNWFHTQGLAVFGAKR